MQLIPDSCISTVFLLMSFFVAPAYCSAYHTAFRCLWSMTASGPFLVYRDHDNLRGTARVFGRLSPDLDLSVFLMNRTEPLVLSKQPQRWRALASQRIRRSVTAHDSTDLRERFPASSSVKVPFSRLLIYKKVTKSRSHSKDLNSTSWRG